MGHADAEQTAGTNASPEVGPLKILYAAGLSPNDSSLYKHGRWAAWA